MTSATGQRVLIVEDEAVVALDIGESVRRLGHDVIATCATAEEAIEIVAREQPDLVLMDIRLRGAMDGIEAGRQINKSWGLPVVYLTAHADDRTLARAKETSPYGYVIKPFEEQKLRVALDLALAKHSREIVHEQHRKDLRAILDTLPMGTILIDGNELLVFANSLARRMLTLPDSAIGRLWTEALPFDSKTRDRLERQMASPPAERRRVGVAVGKPSNRSLEIEIADDPREDTGRILFLHDVSEVEALRAELEEGAEFENMIGRSEGMQRVFHLIGDLAKVDSSVLIHGETGTGKELVARALHRRSSRAGGPFVAVNCGGLSDELAASQLFGHVRGSFTGAITDHVGYFEAAESGVLFLDEIGELSDRVQAGLLRVLEDQRISRVGDSETRQVDVRLIVATHRDLDREIRDGAFRADLYYRIRVAQIDLPPLRSRREDIPLLTDRFLKRACATTRKTVTEVAEETLGVLLDHRWPGNVRELRNAIEFGVIRSRGETLEARDLPREIYSLASDGLDGTDEEQRIRAALVKARGHRKKAAELLGMSRATFYRRLKEYRIELD